MFRFLIVWMALAAATLSAQAAGEFVWHPIREAGTTAVALLWQQGLDEADAPGAARVLAECRLLRARAQLPGLLASGALVVPDATVIFGLVSATDPTAPAAFVSALLDDQRPLSDDQIALVVARTALAADDAEFLYPGTVLETRARAALCVGVAARAAAGSPTAIAALTPAMVRERLLAPVPVWGAGLGLVSEASRAAMAAVRLPTVAPLVRAAIDPVAPAPVAVMSVELHARIDEPFVAASFPAPPPVSWPTFALGIEVARSRALRRFRIHGSEFRGHAPPVHWSWLEADPLVVFCRRGVDAQMLLPGERATADAEAESEATRRELEALLASLRDEPPKATELAAAVRVLQAELALPGGEAMQLLARTGKALPSRLQTWMLATHRGIDVTALSTVTAVQVNELLRQVLAAAGGSWHTLLPMPRTDRGWLPR